MIFSKRVGAPLDGAVVGVPRDYFFEGGDQEVVATVERALDVFRRLGAAVARVHLPDCHKAYAAANATFAEGDRRSSGSAAGRPGRLQRAVPDPLRVHAPGTAARLIGRAPVVPGQIHGRRGARIRGAPMSLSCRRPRSRRRPSRRNPPHHDKERRKNACIFDFTGQPSISVPCGFTAQGLPVGLMICGRIGQDLTVLRFAHAFEQATPWHDRRPPLACHGLPGQ